MRINRIAHLSFSGGEDERPENSSGGLTVNPLAESLTPAQIKIYEAAFLRAREDVEREQNAWGDWSI